MKSRTIIFRLTEEQHLQFLALAKQSNQSITNLILNSVLKEPHNQSTIKPKRIYKQSKQDKAYIQKPEESLSCIDKNQLNVYMPAPSVYTAPVYTTPTIPASVPDDEPF